MNVFAMSVGPGHVQPAYASQLLPQFERSFSNELGRQRLDKVNERSKPSMTTFGDFDIPQDGSQVVLERVQERSDVVLWIPYHNLASTQPSDRRARSIRESLQPGG